MKKTFNILSILSILSLFICGCSNNMSNYVPNNDDYQNALNETNNSEDTGEIQENIMDNNILIDDNNEIAEELDENIPEEYKTALEKAKLYVENQYLSKLGLYERLISKPLNFSKDAAQYAIENYNCDYFSIAVNHAIQHNNVSNNSKDVFYEYLISSAKFTEEEAQYAIDNAGIDWQENALNRVKDYKDVLSIDEMRVKLTQLGFTEEEINYALDNLE